MIVVDVESKYLFKCAVGAFRLSIRLGMIRGASCKLGAKGLMKSFPKMANETAVSIGDNGIGQAMWSENGMEKLLCNLGGIIRYLAWVKVYHFGKSIDENGDGVVAVGRCGEMSDEVHADA